MYKITTGDVKLKEIYQLYVHECNIHVQKTEFF